MPDFTCDHGGVSTPLQHVWEHTLGSGHATLALRADWQRQLRRCHDELGTRHVRFHGLLSDDMGTLVREDDKLIDSFFNADQIFDALLDMGMRPFVELSFMPTALASGSTQVFHYQANVTPPTEPRQWGTLIRKFARHLVDRYGAGEVSQWFFEVWNEPNLAAFWTGSQRDYFDLYRHTVEAIKGVDASLRVGGPATAQNAWIEEFIDYCDAHHLPADFISTHYYPTDALGNADTDTMSQLAGAPPFVMRDHAKETHRLARQRPIYYTEWNITSNPRDHLHDEPFAAALATNILMHVDPLVDGYSYWTFSDIFEENYFPSEPFQGGFGLLNLYGIPKPAYRAFELLHHLGRQRLDVIGSHPTVSVWAIREPHAVTLLLTNHAMPRHRIRSADVHIALDATLPPRAAHVQRIDKDHANAHARWIAMGKPRYLSTSDVADLERASQLVRESLPVTYVDGVMSIDITLPPHAVAAVTIEFAGGSDK
jgi:xylan 1,4-beta-xylosidase